MRISLNEIKKLVPAAAEVDTDELIKLIGSRLVEVEEKIDLAPKYAGIFVVKVVECEPIPDTHLHLCQIENGTEKIQVVCGAPNVRQGMHAVWIAPGSIVPETYGDENFKLDVRKLRGYESHGMLAGLDELDLGEDHSGIVEISPDIPAGTAFAEAFDLNDIILDIENKSLTHRPDCFGLIGFAREVAGILGVEFMGGQSQSEKISFSPTSAVTTSRLRRAKRWTGDEPRNDVREERFGEKDIFSLSLEITNPALCPRYSCAILEMKDALSDDKYLTASDIFLAKAGMHGISKIVDVTNYLMLMTGQPLHAFDYDKFVKVGNTSEPKIIVRAAKSGEELQLLDGKTITCSDNDILITSNNIPVALAGAMGGKSTEIDTSTKKVILESATFSLYNLRKTQMEHGIFSEAITRFTKGQPATQTLPVLEKACELLGNQVLAVVDEYPCPAEAISLQITTQEINRLLGTYYDAELIIRTLENVGFIIETSESVPLGESPKCIRITVPSWRTDIHIKEDLIEEVGRLLGYDNIPLLLPSRPFIAVAKNPLLALKTELRDILSGRLSANEVLTYSFVSEKLQLSVGENPNDSYKIINSLSPELQCFRQSLVPSLLEKIQLNLKSGYKDFSLYEANQVTKKSLGKDNDGVPVLENHLSLVTAGDFYRIKSLLLAVLEECGLRDNAISAFEKSDSSAAPYFEPLHSATLTSLDNNSLTIARFGELKPTVLKRLKISEPLAAFELDLDALLSILPKSHNISATISKFPSVERDLTLKVDANLSFAKVKSVISRALSASGLIFEITPSSIYQATLGSTTKNLSFHLRFSSPKKTLTGSEISAIMEDITKSAKTAVGAEIV